MRDAGRLLAMGLIAGTVLSLLAARAASKFLFGVTPSDPVTLAVAALGLAGVATLASYLPAARAAGLEPTVALRED